MHDKQSVDLTKIWQKECLLVLLFVLHPYHLEFSLLLVWFFSVSLLLCSNKLSLFGEKSQPLLCLMIQMKVMNEAWEWNDYKFCRLSLKWMLFWNSFLLSNTSDSCSCLPRVQDRVKLFIKRTFFLVVSSLCSLKLPEEKEENWEKRILIYIVIQSFFHSRETTA